MKRNMESWKSLQVKSLFSTLQNVNKKTLIRLYLSFIGTLVTYVLTGFGSNKMMYVISSIYLLCNMSHFFYSSSTNQSQDCERVDFFQRWASL